VRIPLMPQGVEHRPAMDGPIMCRLVRIPLMPQGVEHADVRSMVRSMNREDSIDAARR